MRSASRAPDSAKSAPGPSSSSSSAVSAPAVKASSTEAVVARCSPAHTMARSSSSGAAASRSARAAAARLRRQTTNAAAACAASAAARVPLLVVCTSCRPRTSMAAKTVGELPKSKPAMRCPPRSPHNCAPGSVFARARASASLGTG